MSRAGLVVPRLNGQAPWPLGWTERLEGWKRGLAYRLDWAPWSIRTVDGLPADTEQLVPDRDALGQPALIGPNRRGALLAFSAHAVNQVRAIWPSYGVSILHSSQWHVSWLNGLQSKGAMGFSSPWGSPGLEMMDCGGIQLVFCPEILGPLAYIRVGERQFQFSADLEVRQGESGLLVRGARVLDGIWRYGRIEPISGVGGWYCLSGVRLS